MGKYIYLIKNTINTKIYVGQTTTLLSKRFRDHCSEAKRYHKQEKHRYASKLYPAMIKYGIDNFYIELLYSASETESLDDLEKYYIDFYKTLDDTYGYNIAKDGDKPPSKNGFKHSTKTKEKISQIQSGKIWCNDGIKEIMVLAGDFIPPGYVKGRLYKGLSGSLNPAYGKPGPNLGKPVSEDTRRKISLTKKANNLKKNKIWVNNGIEAKCIDLNVESIPAGFVKGRLITSKMCIGQKQPIIIHNKVTGEIIETNDLAEAASITSVSIPTILKSCKTNMYVKYGKYLFAKK